MTLDLEILRAFFGWGALLNLVFLSLIFVFFLLCRNMIYRIHSRWFCISKETFHGILYAAMAWYKLSVFIFFIIPYLVLRFFV